MTRSHARLVLSALPFLSGELFGQELLREHVKGFGIEVTGLRDLNGDAIGDYALSDFNGNAEIVQVRSGSSGLKLFTITGSQPKASEFGAVLADAGDVNGDGISDLLIGAILYVDPGQMFVEPGAVFVHSGRDGSLLWSLYGSADGDWLGTRVSGLDDVDGDGFADFLAGARQLATSKGYVRCYSGKTGTMLYQVDGVAANDSFAFVSALSDHDHDGVRDFAVSAFSYTRICSGATGATIATIPCPTGGNYGAQCEVDDLDGDGEAELAIAEADPLHFQDGEVRVVSIPTQTVLRIHSGDEPLAFFGTELESVVDADSDGVRDYVVGAPGFFNSRGSASLFSGRTGERLYRFADPAASYFMGNSVADAGDLDGDGRSELLIGSPLHSETAGDGAALVFRGNDLWLDADLKRPAAGDAETLATHGAPAGNPVALFITDLNGTPTTQLFALGAADATEAFRAQGTVPVGLSGMTMTFRSYAIGGSGRVITSADETIFFQ